MRATVTKRWSASLVESRPSAPSVSACASAEPRIRATTTAKSARLLLTLEIACRKEILRYRGARLHRVEVQDSLVSGLLICHLPMLREPPLAIRFDELGRAHDLGLEEPARKVVILHLGL